MRRVVRVAVHLLCLLPMAWIWIQLHLGHIRGDWVKEITHWTGFSGLIFIALTLAVTPVRRLTGFNQIQSYRRPLGLYAFFYICVHFLVLYIILDKQVPFDPAFAWSEIVKDIAKRPYITVGFTGFVLMIPLALTSTKASIRRLGKKWIPLHSLIYLTALAGVVHSMWSQKADQFRPTVVGLIIVALLAIRLVPRRRRVPRPAPGPLAEAAPAPQV